MAMRIKNKAKVALICGAASCACPFVAAVLERVSYVLLSPAWRIVSLAAACFVVLGMILAIAGLLFCRSATKEPGAQRSGFFAAGLIFSVLGFVYSCRGAYAMWIY